jgi:hypothetical protein
VVPAVGPYPLQSGTLTDFKTTADRSAERSDRPPELYATSNGYPDTSNSRKVDATHWSHTGRFMWSLGYDRSFTTCRDHHMTREPCHDRHHMLVTAPTAGRVTCFCFHSHAKRFPQLRCSQSPRAAPASLSRCNMTGLNIAFGLEPQQPTPLMRIG